MPFAWTSKERLRVFRDCLQATTTTPEVLPEGDELWKDGWRIVVELLDQAEGMLWCQVHVISYNYSYTRSYEKL